MPLYNSQSNIACGFVNDAITYPDPWTKEAAETFTITQDKLENTSTCGLIQTFFNQPWNKVGPWNYTTSNLNIDGVQYFNDRIEKDIVLNELFSRDDAMKKLVKKYIDIIKDPGSMETHPGYLHSFEILLASKSTNKILTDTVCDELMILALKMMEVKKKTIEFNNKSSLATTRHVLANLLLWKQFTPFMTPYVKNGSLETWQLGYKICSNDGVVENYAKMYLTN